MFRVKRIDLIGVLEEFHKITSQKSTLQMLGFVAFDKTGDKLLLKTTNLEVFRQSVIEEASGADFKGCFSNSLLLPFLKASYSEFVAFEVLFKNQVIIKCDSSELKVSYLEYEEFPKNSVCQDDTKFLLNVNADKLYEMLDSVAFAASTDTTRYNLNCIHLEFNSEKNALETIALDGQRMARSRMRDVTKEESVAAHDYECNLSLRVTSLLIAYLKSLSDKRVELWGAGNFCLIKYGDNRFECNLLDVKFPSYKKQIANYLADYKRLQIDKGVLRNMLIKAQIMYDFGSRAIFQFGKSNMKVDVLNLDKGNVIDIVPALSNTGTLDKISFNPFYLSDILDVLNDNEVNIYYKNEESSIIVDTDNKSESNVINMGVIMPMRIR